MKKIILASNNKNKMKEISEKLKQFNIQIISQANAGIDIDVEETGTTFEENAALKAETIYRISKQPVISDDSGLEVDYLNGEPGVYSKRFAGPDADDAKRINKILNLMKDAKEEDRTARYTCAICYIDSKGEKHIFKKSCEGKIINEPRGNCGFGYDPIFLYGNKTFAELNSEEKNKVSHRGMAIEALVQYFKENELN